MSLVNVVSQPSKSQCLSDFLTHFLMPRAMGMEHGNVGSLMIDLR